MLFRSILIHLEQLNDNGANLDIENVVAAMDPKDVLCNLTLATKFGANIDVNDLLDSTKVVMVYARYIDEMLALGADPQKIANKISAVEVGYEHGHWESYSFTRTGKFIKKHPEIFKLVYERVRNEVATKAA